MYWHSPPPYAILWINPVPPNTPEWFSHGDLRTSKGDLEVKGRSCTQPWLGCLKRLDPATSPKLLLLQQSSLISFRGWCVNPIHIPSYCCDICGARVLGLMIDCKPPPPRLPLPPGTVPPWPLDPSTTQPLLFAGELEGERELWIWWCSLT